MNKVIIFDFDYTLGDSTNGIITSISYALSILGHEIPDFESIKATIGLSLKDTYFKLTNDNNQDNANLFSKYFKEKADEVMVDNTLLYKNTKDVLINLKNKNYKIAIVTTKFHYRIQQILEKYNIRNIVDIIVGAEDVAIEKPAPEGILKVLSTLNLDKQEAIYVGDSFVDAKAASKAKVDFIGVTTGTTTIDEFDKYNCLCICNDIFEVYNYIVAKD